MKPIRIFVFILLLFQVNNVVAQNLFSWQRVGFPVLPQEITLSNGMLYAYTTDETFISEDLGSTWQFYKHHLDATFLAAQDSICIFRLPPKDLIGYNPPLIKLGMSTTITGYNSIYGYQLTGYGNLDLLWTEKLQILNDNTILYENIHKTVTSANQGSPGSTTYTVENGIIFTDHSINTDTFLYNPLGHINQYFVTLNDSLLVFQEDEALQIYFTKAAPNFSYDYSTMLDSSIFLLNNDGHTLESNNLGDSWIQGDIGISNIIDYQCKNGLHIIKNNSGDFLSTNFKDFVPFPTLDPLDSLHKKYYVFDSLVFTIGRNPNQWYRSFDKGSTWEIINPDGISSLDTTPAFSFNNTFYTIQNGTLYTPTCAGGDLELSTDNLFLVASNFTHKNIACKVQENNLYLSNLETQNWQLSISNYTDDLNGIYKDQDKIYIYGSTLQVSSDDGSSWATIETPSQNITNFYAKANILYLSENNTNYYSSDFGLSWVTISDGPYYILNDNFYLLQTIANQDVLLKYTDPTQAPTDSFPTPTGFYPDEEIVKYLSAGDFVFCLKSVIKENWISIPNEIYLFHNDEWRIVSSDFPLWNEEAFHHFYFKEYRWRRGFSDIIYNEGDHSLYFKTLHSTIQKTSIGLLDSTPLASTTVIHCAGDPSTIDHNYIKHSPCEPDTIVYVETYEKKDTVYTLSPCQDSLLFEGQYYQFPGTYSLSPILSFNGCDSIGRTLKLAPIHVKHIYLEQEQYCPKDTVLWNGKIITSTGFFTDAIQNFCGKDSIILHKYFDFYSPTKIYENHFLCEGDTLFHNQLAITTPGVYELDTITNSIGCDSIINLLKIKGVEEFTSNISATIGSKVSGVLINGDTIFTQIIYSELYGCDSLRNIITVTTTPVATNDLLAQKIKLYPNPTNDLLFISDLPKGASIKILNAMNQLIFEQRDLVKTIVKIDVSPYPVGIYLLEISFANGQYQIFKFSKSD